MAKAPRQADVRVRAASYLPYKEGDPIPVVAAAAAAVVVVVPDEEEEEEGVEQVVECEDLRLRWAQITGQGDQQ